ncbi:uncharacterized protein LDX57_006470 [Aspergillus melleus]|uniref:uncharacterized protein n=1 Tax=Aspergillus melleus TaxID=138277 RepID=UPI001E8DB91B|nr:uncharacterized protein LDX57_006470 [Aspergillus melleus]KAH8428790.1 hypothetical protein LDX57_006470 [Aspergillus melleus]
MFDSHPTEGKPPSFKGSAIMYLAESKEAAIELIKKDIYTVSGVWDVENAQVIPFKSAVRVGL